MSLIGENVVKYKASGDMTVDRLEEEESEDESEEDEEDEI
jgi:hypothetical protein